MYVSSYFMEAVNALSQTVNPGETHACCKLKPCSPLREQELFYVLQMNDDMRAKIT